LSALVHEAEARRQRQAALPPQGFLRTEWRTLLVAAVIAFYLVGGIVGLFLGGSHGSDSGIDCETEDSWACYPWERGR
jgi:hypothetical protein